MYTNTTHPVHAVVDLLVDPGVELVDGASQLGRVEVDIPVFI
jgi:hypothetical protein